MLIFAIPARSSTEGVDGGIGGAPQLRLIVHFLCMPRPLTRNFRLMHALG